MNSLFVISFLNMLGLICLHFSYAIVSTRISLGLSHHLSLSFITPGRSSRLHPVSAHSCWSSNLCSSISRGPQEYIAYEFVFCSPAVFRMPGLSNLDSFVMGGGWPYRLLFCWVLSPGLVQYCSQHSCVIAIKPFLHTFSYRPCGASI